MYKPKISIITAVYNRADKIEQCISSVVSQTYDNIEYIVIDGGSADGTVDVIKKYADRIAYWCSEPDKGIYDAWNKGLAHATGDYVNFIGSDDAMYGDDAVQNIAGYLTDDVDVLAGNLCVIEEKSKFEHLSANESVKNKQEYQGGCIATQGTFVRRELCNKYGFDTSYKAAADYKFFLQYYHDGKTKIKFVDDVVQYFSNDGISSDANYDFVRNEDNRAYRELGLLNLVDCHVRQREADGNRGIKALCKTLGVFYPVKLFYHAHIKKDWHRHHCSNKICRWCGRGGVRE